MSENKTAVQLEGWLPGDERNGLIRIGESSMDAFNEAYDAEEDTTAATLQVVVGLVEVTRVARRRHPEEKPPVVAYRFLHLEVAGDQFGEAARAILDKLHADRTGNDPLPGLSGNDDDDPGEGPEILAAAAERDGDLVESTGGEQTSRVTEIGQAKKRAAKKAVRRRRTPPGQTPRH